MDTVLVKKDGSRIWCSVHSVLFKDGEDTLGYTTIEDISERKALETKHQALYDAQQTVMYTVAHDLKRKAPSTTSRRSAAFSKKKWKLCRRATPTGRKTSRTLP